MNEKAWIGSGGNVGWWSVPGGIGGNEEIVIFHFMVLWSCTQAAHFLPQLEQHKSCRVLKSQWNLSHWFNARPRHERLLLHSAI